MDKASHVALMVSCFPTQDGMKGFVATLLEICEDYSVAVVKEGCDDFRHGRVEGCNPSFMPSTAVFSKHLHKLHNAAVRGSYLQKQITSGKSNGDSLTLQQHEAWMQRCHERLEVINARHSQTTPPYGEWRQQVSDTVQVLMKDKNAGNFDPSRLFGSQARGRAA